MIETADDYFQMQVNSYLFDLGKVLTGIHTNLNITYYQQAFLTTYPVPIIDYDIPKLRVRYYENNNL